VKDKTHTGRDKPGCGQAVLLTLRDLNGSELVPH